MKIHSSFTSVFALSVATLALALVPLSQVLRAAEGQAHGRKSGKIEISRDAASGTVTVSWGGRGLIKQSSTLDGKFRPVHSHGGSHTVIADAPQMIYAAESIEGLFSVNAVGYVNLWLPPGLSLISNPLRNYEITVQAVIVGAPDGAQVYKYVPGAGYEVSAYDAVQGVWSNPDMDLSPGVGFFFSNTASSNFVVTFVGEVLQGVLVNPLPAGFSTEGALVPQAGSINSLHGIPGEPGDILRLYVNDGVGGGDYVSSIFSAAENAWVPDLTLGVAEGFVTEKQHAQDWVRVFCINCP